MVFAGSSHVSSGFKMYDIEGLGDCTISESNARLLMEAASKRRFGGHNERFHETVEWERRVQKCKYRLISATEDAFASVQSIIANNQQNKVFRCAVFLALRSRGRASVPALFML